MSSIYAKYKDLGDKEELMDVDKGLSPQVNEDSILDNIESSEHKEWVIQNNKVVVVDVYGDWCGPCKSIEPRYKEMTKQYSRAGECAVVKEDIDKKITTNIRGVPTFQFFFKGQPAGIITGGDIRGVENKLIQLLQQP